MVLSFPTDIRAVKSAILSALELELCGCGGGCGGRRGVVVEVGGCCSRLAASAAVRPAVRSECSAVYALPRVSSPGAAPP